MNSGREHGNDEGPLWGPQGLLGISARRARGCGGTRRLNRHFLARALRPLLHRGMQFDRLGRDGEQAFAPVTLRLRPFDRCIDPRANDLENKKIVAVHEARTG